MNYFRIPDTSNIYSVNILILARYSLIIITIKAVKNTQLSESLMELLGPNHLHAVFILDRLAGEKL